MFFPCPCQVYAREALEEECLIRSLIGSKYINPNSTQVAGASPSLCLVCAFYFGFQVVKLAVSLKIRLMPLLHPYDLCFTKGCAAKQNFCMPLQQHRGPHL